MTPWIFESNASLSKVCGKSASSEDAVSMLYFSVIFQDCFRLKENQKCLEQVFLLRYSMNEYLSFR